MVLKTEDITENTIREYIERRYLGDIDTDEDKKQWMQNVTEKGCVSGIAMVLYEETYNFYEAFADEIWDIVDDMADEFGMTPMKFLADMVNPQLSGGITDDVAFRNMLAWLAFEKVVGDMYGELGGD